MNASGGDSTARAEGLPAGHVERGCTPVPRSVTDISLERLHVAAACVTFLLLPLATAPKDAASVLLLAVTLIRLPTTAPLYAALLRQPIVWLLLAWPAWHAVTLAWSPDRALGVDEWRALRAVALPFLLWPVLDRAGAIVIAFLIGVVCLTFFQMLAWFEVLGLEPDHRRLGGFLGPISAGASCAIALPLLTCMMVRARGGRRAIAGAGFAAALAGLIASGSRGPWLSALGAMTVLLVLLAWRWRAARRTVIIVALLLLVAGGASATTGFVQQRVQRGISEAREALRGGDLTTDVGLRLWLWSWAWEQFRSAPIGGVGAGGFPSGVRVDGAYQAHVLAHPDDAHHVARDHPHSMYLHVLATTGLIGGVILAAVLFLALRQGLRDTIDPLMSTGACAGMVGWCIGAVFNCYNLSGLHMIEFMMLLTITLPQRSRPAAARGAPAASESTAGSVR